MSPASGKIEVGANIAIILVAIVIGVVLVKTWMGKLSPEREAEVLNSIQ
jgi:hypothetical protein